jgi:hypothetical protein
MDGSEIILHMTKDTASWLAEQLCALAETDEDEAEGLADMADAIMVVRDGTYDWAGDQIDYMVSTP